jgi:hypothetical protein
VDGSRDAVVYLAVDLREGVSYRYTKEKEEEVSIRSLEAREIEELRLGGWAALE